MQYLLASLFDLFLISEHPMPTDTIYATLASTAKNHNRQLHENSFMLITSSLEVVSMDVSKLSRLSRIFRVQPW